MKTTPDLIKMIAAGSVRSAELARDFPTEGYVIAYGPYAMAMYVTDKPEGESYGLLGTCIKIFRTEGEADEVARRINAGGFYTTQVRSMSAAEWRVEFLVGTVKLLAEAVQGVE